MPQPEELKVRLTLDTSDSLANQMKDSFKPVEGVMPVLGQQANQAFTTGFKQSALATSSGVSILLGNIYTKAFEKVTSIIKGLFVDAFKAFEDGQQQIKDLSNAISLIDQEGRSLQSLTTEATKIKDAFGVMGMQVGIADDRLQSVFKTLISQGQFSTKTAQELTKNVALVGKVSRGGAEELAKQLVDMQGGMLEMKSPIVGLIAANHLLKGSARDVHQQLMKMPIEKQMKLAQEAIKQTSDRLEKAPLTFSELVTSSKIFTTNMLEAIGGPMIERVSEIGRRLQGAFLNADGTSTKLTDKITAAASFFGDVFVKAIDIGGVFFDAFGTFAEENKAIWASIFGNGNDQFKSMVDLAKLIAEVLGATFSAISVTLGVAVKIVQEVIKTLSTFLGFAAKGAADLFGGSDFANKLDKLGTNLVQSTTGRDARQAAAQIAQGGLSAQDEQAARLRLSNDALAAGLDANTLLREARQGIAQTQSLVQQAKEASLAANTEQFVAAYNQAVSKEDEAAQKRIAGILKTDAAMAKALENSPNLLGKNVDQFTKTLVDIGQTNIANELKSITSPSIKMAPKNTTINYNLNGPISIKQDFKDQDPNEVALIFKKDLMKHASAPLQARTVMPFGF